MDMKKTFIGVGVGVMVVTGLIQSGVIDVNQVSTTDDFALSGHPIGKTIDENWSGKVKPQESSNETRQPDTTIKPFNPN
jgi:hypothetical protein